MEIRICNNTKNRLKCTVDRANRVEEERKNSMAAFSISSPFDTSTSSSLGIRAILPVVQGIWTSGHNSLLLRKSTVVIVVVELRHKFADIELP